MFCHKTKKITDVCTIKIKVRKSQNQKKKHNTFLLNNFQYRVRVSALFISNFRLNRQIKLNDYDIDFLFIL